MRKLWAILLLVCTTVLVLILDRPIGSLPALGRLLDPVNGSWANAESTDKNFNTQLNISALQQPVTIWLDERLVPHIHAANEHDLYFAQGYIHACFRLWQMDMQTRAAAGRVSEVIGEKGIKFDRTQRRKGMVYAAENSLKVMEADKRTKDIMDAYAAGVNQYISVLKYRDYPVEYKLMGFKPEPWTNLKCALLLKYMADDLTGNTEDIAQTFIRGKLDEQEFNYLFPEKIQGSTPVIPLGTIYEGSLKQPEQPADSIARIYLSAGDYEREDNEGKGSNNWALSGSRTRSGAAILCNDPHLGLNLPSLWFEVQLQSPDLNVYGASLPGAPGVVIGFNDSISWGLTNNYRDVKDFYAIQQHGDKYSFEGNELAFNKRVEIIKVKGKSDVIDTINYTVHGPVMYDEEFHGPGGIKIPLAMSWMAHRSTNELLSLYLLNRSKNYNEFVKAIQQFQCPAQNMIYADRHGNIALWGQGQFVNKWKGQGRYIMNGTDIRNLWQELIPMNENPHALNPPQGFLSSANQSVTDSTYPYWYNGTFYEFRAWRINQVLSGMQKATVEDMFALQNDIYSILASQTLPLMLNSLPANITAEEKKYADILKKWNYELDYKSEAATIYQLWWAIFYKSIWKDRFRYITDILTPSPERTVQLMQNDINAFPAFSNVVMQSYQQAVDSIGRLKNGTQWYVVKNTTINHLTKLPAFSYAGLKTGGWGNTVNAMKGNHGPTWRMVVEMGQEINAYGVYPGGQSGNPGSKYYAAFLDHWVQGKYYKLDFLPNSSTQNSDAVKYTWTMKPKS